MNAITEKAHAKINLSVDILGTMPDGYHEMRMVMQSVSLCDEIVIKPNNSGRFFAKNNLAYLPHTDKNIAVKAARLFFYESGMPKNGADINIKKRIPVCAGLGGGSSDAAAVLRGLNRYYGRPFDAAALEKMSCMLGSDVAFCVQGGAALATGKGNTLQPLPGLKGCVFVICKPSFSISTPSLFGEIDKRDSALRPDTDGIIKSLENNDVAGVAKRLYNIFEDVLPHKYDEIGVIKNRLLDLGAIGTSMTGTGSAVYGIFAGMETARVAHEEMSKTYKECFKAVPSAKRKI